MLSRVAYSRRQRDPAMYDHTGRQPITRTIRFAISAGVLTPSRIRERQDEARRLGTGFLEVLTEAELMHLQLIKKTLRPEATWEAAVGVIQRHGSDGA